MEPAYPGIVAHYINLGDCYNRERLYTFKNKYGKLKKEYQELYIRAYQYIKASSQVRENGEGGYFTQVVEDKMHKRVKGILSREIKNRKGVAGKEKKRFLSSINCEGVTEMFDTIYHQAKRVYEIQDAYGISYRMLNMLKEAIVQRGYDIVSYHSPLQPEKIEHIYVPELQLAFVRASDSYSDKKRPYRRIRMESILEKEQLKNRRPQFKFTQRVANELQRDAISFLKTAKEVHDKMEETYAPYVNFEKADQMTDELIREIEHME